jgi:hypothetical protein
MATVYLAQDLHHHRPVALHVDDGPWEAEEARASTRGSEPPPGEVTIALEEKSVEVLVPACRNQEPVRPTRITRHLRR